MATQAFIIEKENAVIAAEKAVREAFKALKLEQKENHGVILANRDCWGTLGVNLTTLKSAIDDFLKGV